MVVLAVDDQGLDGLAVGRKILDANVTPFDLLPGRLGTMDLQGDEAGRSHIIGQIGHRHAIDPRADAIADCFDAVVIHTRFA